MVSQDQIDAYRARKSGLIDLPYLTVDGDPVPSDVEPNPWAIDAETA